MSICIVKHIKNPLVVGAVTKRVGQMTTTQISRKFTTEIGAGTSSVYDACDTHSDVVTGMKGSSIYKNVLI